MRVDHHKNIVEVRDLSFSFGSEVVLRNINLDIHLGDYLGIVGPNGGGKTTLLKLMLGLLRLQQGSIKLFGEDITNFRDWHKIGYVAQKAVNFDSGFPATVEEITSMGRFGQRGVLRRLNKDDKQIIEQSLAAVGMLELSARLIGNLSAGQQQRVLIARALASKPEILFLDEPTVGIDSEAQEEFYKILHKLNSELDLTLVLVSHDIDIIAQETTELACINRNLVYHGSPEEFLKEDSIKKLYGQNIKFIPHHHV
jgi:zinc transport system ATP-binding protein